MIQYIKFELSFHSFIHFVSKKLNVNVCINCESSFIDFFLQKKLRIFFYVFFSLSTCMEPQPIVTLTGVMHSV